MDGTTLTALRQSIEKWERNAIAETHRGFTLSADDFALCQMFLRGGCIGCPVKSKTGRKGCFGTPFGMAIEAKVKWGLSRKLTQRDAAHAAARAEVEFLRSLLPEAETTP